MNITELLNSTYMVGRTRSPEYVFSRKEFGNIYAFNKSIIYRPGFNIIELNMYITSKTDLNKGLHRVRVAFKGINAEEISITDLYNKIRKKPEYKDLTDENINKLLTEEKNIYKTKLILPIENSVNKYLIVDNHIPLKTEIRVKCSCSDYYYTWGWYNFQHGVHIGKRPLPYLHHSKFENGEPVTIRNVNKRPGVCKHLLLFFALLMNDEILNKSARVNSNYARNELKFSIYSHKNIQGMLKNLNKELNRERKERIK